MSRRFQNHILYALWKQETFTITFEANGGTVAYRYIGIPVGTSYSAFPCDGFCGGNAASAVGIIAEF